MMAWAKAQARARGLADAADYVRDLIERDQERARARAALQAAITEGMESGIGTLSPAELLAEAHRRAGVMVQGDV
jgi:antitoxin ParD1/3/4